jgi:hypothetical protein
VKSLLQAVKSELVDFVHVKGHAINLNFGVGALTFNAAGCVEFKSAAAMDTASTFSTMDVRSKTGDGMTEKSMRSM